MVHMRRSVHEKSRIRILESLPGTEAVGDYPLQRVLLNSRQVCAALGIKERTLKYWTATKRGKRPRLSFVKLGKAKRFEAGTILEFIDRMKVRSDSDANRRAA